MGMAGVRGGVKFISVEIMNIVGFAKGMTATSPMTGQFYFTVHC